MAAGIADHVWTCESESNGCFALLGEKPKTATGSLSFERGTNSVGSLIVLTASVRKPDRTPESVVATGRL